jgi:biotin transport system substrate-specific component
MDVAVRVNQAKYNWFLWRYELSIPKKIALALLMAAITGLVAQLRVMLPWSPVPLTGQTFAALLAGVMLGKWWGGASMGLYAGLGAAGLPWFQAGNSGLAYLAGPTGGYIIGFILAALFIGYFTDKYIRSRSFTGMFSIMVFASLVLIYVPGLLQLGLWMHFVKGEAVSITTLLGMGAVPFIAGDVTKSVIAAALTRGITPKKAYNGEADQGKWSSWRLP